MDLKQLMLDPRLLAIAVAAVLVIVVVAWLSARRRRTAARLLANREQRVGPLDIRELNPAERERFSMQWLALQPRFVDDPTFAVTEADAIVTSLMQTRGYPVADFDQRAAEMSVAHSGVVANYRSAHVIAVRVENGESRTEDLRTAMIHYRSLFAELVHAPPAVRLKEVA